MRAINNVVCINVRVETCLLVCSVDFTVQYLYSTMMACTNKNARYVLCAFLNSRYLDVFNFDVSHFHLASGSLKRHFIIESFTCEATNDRVFSKLVMFSQLLV